MAITESCEHYETHRGQCVSCDEVIDPDWEPDDCDLPSFDYYTSPAFQRLEAWANKVETHS